jgi:hypothetical protein
MGLDKVLINLYFQLGVEDGTSFDTNLPLLKPYLKRMTLDLLVEVVDTVPPLLHLLIL